MISSILWIQKNTLNEFPKRQKLTEQEFNNIKQKLNFDLNEQELISDFNQADTSDDGIQGDGEEMQGDGDSNGEQMEEEMEEMEDDEMQEHEEEDEEDEEDPEETRIDKDDSILLVAKTIDQVSYLEVNIYENENLYVHHDIMLPAFPLDIEYINHNTHNYCAIGSFDAHVEIWDLDIIDPCFPAIILGEFKDSNLKNSKKNYGPARVAKKINPKRHVDAVMGIAWNSTITNLVCTASADTTIKLWDLNSSTDALQQYTHHTDKVQAVEFNSFETTVVLSGGYDSKAFVFDTRSSGDSGSDALMFDVGSDVESLKWDPRQKHLFYVGGEDGIVTCFDVRYIFL